MKRERAVFLFDLFLLAIVIVLFIIPALSLAPLPRQIPLAVSLLLIMLLLIKVFRDFRIMRQQGDKNFEEQGPRDYGASRKVLLSIVWVFVLIAGFYYIGMVLTSLLFPFFFIRFYGKESWKTAIISTGVSVILIYGLFGLLMRFPLYHGVLQFRLPGLL